MTKSKRNAHHLIKVLFSWLHRAETHHNRGEAQASLRAADEVAYQLRLRGHPLALHYQGLANQVRLMLAEELDEDYWGCPY